MNNEPLTLPVVVGRQYWLIHDSKAIQATLQRCILDWAEGGLAYDLWLQSTDNEPDVLIHEPSRLFNTKEELIASL